MVPTGVTPCTKLERNRALWDGRRVYDVIVAHIDPEPCAFRPYCRWLIDRLTHLGPTRLLTWPPEVEHEDFVEVELDVLQTRVVIHLDRWICVACASVPATPTGARILGIIEQAHRAC